jgi:hypothetical protein
LPVPVPLVFTRLGTKFRSQDRETNQSIHTKFSFELSCFQSHQEITSLFRMIYSIGAHVCYGAAAIKMHYTHDSDSLDCRSLNKLKEWWKVAFGHRPLVCCQAWTMIHAKATRKKFPLHIFIGRSTGREHDLDQISHETHICCKPFVVIVDCTTCTSSSVQIKSNFCLCEFFAFFTVRIIILLPIYLINLDWLWEY